jgi:transcriptional regulator with XRE-family HTH domain
MIGDRLRDIRHSQQLSLMQVAGKAKISAATLSRIETNKQPLDLALFLILAKILKTPPREILAESDGSDSEQELVRRISQMDGQERADLWRDLAASRRSQRQTRAASARTAALQIEELLAQVEFLRSEIEGIRLRLKKR